MKRKRLFFSPASVSIGLHTDLYRLRTDSLQALGVQQKALYIPPMPKRQTFDPRELHLPKGRAARRRPAALLLPLSFTFLLPIHALSHNAYCSQRFSRLDLWP